MPKFILPNGSKETTIISGRYAFVNGEMPTTVAEAKKLSRILTRFYGCKLVQDKVEAAPVEEKKADSSLKAESTKTDKAAK